MRVTTKTENEALLTMLNGVESLLETVGQSLGPFGRATVIISPHRELVYTTHGIEIVRAFEVADPLAQIAVRFLRQGAGEVNRLAGDATTSAMIVTGSLFNEAVKLITSGHNSASVRSGVTKALNAALAHVRSMSQPVKDQSRLTAVARTASRGETRDVDAVIQTSEFAGEFGYISIEVTEPANIDHDLATSIIVDEGIPAYGKIAGFTPDAPMDCPFDVVVLNGDPFRRIEPATLVSDLAGRQKPVLLFVNTLRTTPNGKDDDSDTVLNSLLQNAESKGLQLIVMVTDGYTSYYATTLEDIAAFAGTQCFSGKGSTTLQVGSVNNARQENGSLILTGGQSESTEFKAHIERVKKIVKQKRSDVDMRRKALAWLLGKYVTLRAFELSEDAKNERRTALNNMMSAVTNAQRTGTIPGGGSAFARIADAIAEARPDDELERFGFEAVRRALTRPLYWIAKNAGKEPTSLLEDVQRADKGIGFDAKTGRLCNMDEAGILDPTVNALAILQVSISTVCNMLKVSSLINIEDTEMSREETSLMDAPGGMHFGGRRGRRI